MNFCDIDFRWKVQSKSSSVFAYVGLWKLRMSLEFAEVNVGNAWKVFYPTSFLPPSFGSFDRWLLASLSRYID